MMSKYVRTDYGIYETEKNGEIRKIIEICDDTFYPDIKEGDLIIDVKGIYEKIIKEADTIEELIDALVLKNLNTNFCIVMNVSYIKVIKDNWQNIINSDSLKNYITYGAIWTDKGLIYVAKLNDKGALEVLGND